jgi:Cd2+/Zn2+-exporting ATPase
MLPQLVKGGKYIEAMARVKAIALDKTRTITYGSVSDVFPNGTSRQEACTAGTEISLNIPGASHRCKQSRRI